ncbi:hypothetical protein SAMN04490239_1339 [Rhodococcus koreensis]|jgi:hypothetical protein|nr:hypothetical protein SAMN04490239_1339 [Rhodococcus koreensis]
MMFGVAPSEADWPQDVVPSAPQERGIQAQGVGAPTSEGSPMTRPASSGRREGREWDFITLLADYDEHDTLALTEFEQWSPDSRWIDERDFRSRPLLRGGCQSAQLKTVVCSAGVTVRQTARVSRTRSSAQAWSAFIDGAATAPARFRRPT